MKIGAAPKLTVSNLQRLPRLMTLHQLARRAGVHRAHITALMLRGQLQPHALQDVGGGREQFLFTLDAVEVVNRAVAAAQNRPPQNPLL
jgi:hypothetical protein